MVYPLIRKKICIDLHLLVFRSKFIKKKFKVYTGTQALGTAHPPTVANLSSHMLSLFLLKRHPPLSFQYRVKIFW